MKCYDRAAEVFGWKRRGGERNGERDGDWLVGYGCATALYPTHIGPAAARVRFDADWRCARAGCRARNRQWRLTLCWPDGGRAPWRRPFLW